MKKTIILVTILTILIISITIVLSKTGIEWGQEGDSYYKQGMYEKALECYKEALNEYPDSPNLLYNIGNTYLKLGQYDNAIYYYEKCLSLKSDHEQALGQIAEAKRLKELQSIVSIPTPLPPTPTPIHHKTPEMVLINGGIFQMGRDDLNRDRGEMPVHSVEVSSFYMGKYEVTNEEYKAFDSNHSGKWSQLDYPVECVSWYDTIAYCNWLSEQEGLSPCYSGSGDNIVLNINNNGYRLPTEAEWEYACRAGTTTLYYWGDKMNDDYCWYDQNSNFTVHPVGQKKPNGFGLYDMSGNIMEYCWDWYEEFYYSNSPYSNPTGPTDPYYNFRVYRGGDWQKNCSGCLSGERNGCIPSACDEIQGFRLVRTAAP